MQNAPVTMIGVAPRGFFGLQVRDSRIGHLAAGCVPSRFARGLSLVARLKPGVSIEQARAEMAVLFRFTIEERTRSQQRSRSFAR